jgi:hypothetical protein
MTLTGTATNAVLATSNWIDQPATIIGGAPFLSTLPLSNVTQNRLSLVARSNGTYQGYSALSPFILVDTNGDINPTSLIAFPKHGLSDGATWRIRGMSAFFTLTSNDTITPASGSISINLTASSSFGSGWFAVIRQNANPNTNWMIGQITSTGTGLSAVTVNVASYGGAGAVSGPWTLYILSPDDLSGTVKYDSRPILASTTSTTSVTLGVGSITLTALTNCYFANGAFIGIYQLSNTANWMRGSVTSYNWITGQLVVNITSTSGTTATFSDIGIARANVDINVWPTVTSFGQGLWGNDYGWGGRLLKGTNYSPPAIHYIPLASGSSTPIYARFWLVEMADALNTNGYIDLAKLVVSPAFQPTINIAYNWQIEWVDPSPRSRARGGQVYSDPRRAYRKLTLTFENQQTVEAFSRLYELDRTQGTVNPILAIVTPNDANNLHRVTIYGSMPSLSPLVSSYFDRYSKQVIIEEWI